jgi:hypothetical protein
MVGGHPKPSPCLKLCSFLYPKNLLPAKIILDEQDQTYEAQLFKGHSMQKEEQVSRTFRLV